MSSVEANLRECFSALNLKHTKIFQRTVELRFCRSVLVVLRLKRCFREAGVSAKVDRGNVELYTN